MKNLNFTGIGMSNDDENEYNTIHISGSWKRVGDIKCDEFKTSGASNVTGSLECDSISCSGAASFGGDVKCRHAISLSGALKAEGNVTAESMKISGTLTGGDVKIEKDATVSGIINSKSLSAENITVNGVATVKGMVCGENITFRYSGIGSKSNVGTIGGTKITVKKKDHDANGFVDRITKVISQNIEPKAILIAEEIEGDEIYLEYTQADVVRGNDIYIGDGCKVGRVEYTGKVTYSEKAEIGEMVEA